MPTGTPFNACVQPYRIRIDDFGSTNFHPAPLLHLLSHTHTDHINGLSAKSFGYTVYCSEDAKQMLLRHEVYAEREYRELDLRAENVRTFSHLKVDPLVHPDGTLYYTGSRDLLKTLPMHRPTKIELSGSESVTITLLDANHCPGAVMFLIEGAQGAVLHTGDFRAEPWFLDSLTRNPFLQPYLFSEKQGRINKSLDAIYLDTACVLSPAEVPTKAAATSGLIELLEMFPDSAYFFINSWTWGYEDIFKAIAMAFQTKIHVDRYKHAIYQNISDPYLRLIMTRNPSETRFHACERFNRCEHVAVENEPGAFTNTTSVLGKRVVYVNPVTMDVRTWNAYLVNTKEQLIRGEIVNNLLVPLSRHSPLPELRSFVSLFRPRRIVPNTLDPRLHHLDWACIDRMFADCLHPSSETVAKRVEGSSNIGKLADEAQNDGDVALKNLVGEGAEVVAAKWADDGKLLKKIGVLRSYLGPAENSAVDRLLGKASASAPVYSSPIRAPSSTIKGKGKAPARYEPASDEETDYGDSDDERGRTAHILFASQAGLDEKENTWWHSSSPASQSLESQEIISQVHEVTKDEPIVENVPDSSKRRGIGRDGSLRLNRLTPPTTPARPRPVANAVRVSPGSPLASKSTARTVQKQLSKTATLRSRGSGVLASPIRLDSSPISDKGSFVKELLLQKKTPVAHDHDHLSLEAGPSTRVDNTRVSLSAAKPSSTRHSISSKKSMKETSASATSSGVGNSGTSIQTRSPLKRSRTTPVASSFDGLHDRPPTKKRKKAGKGGEEERVPSTPEATPDVIPPSNPPSDTSRPAAPAPPAPPVLSSPPRRRKFTREETIQIQCQSIAMGAKWARGCPENAAPSFYARHARLVAKYGAYAGVSLLDMPVPLKASTSTSATATAGVEKKQVNDDVDHGVVDDSQPAASSSSGSNGTRNAAAAPLGLVGEKTVLSFETVEDSQEGRMVNWERSRELEEAVRRDVRLGKKPTLPPLLCTLSESQSESESWSQEV